MNRKDSPPWQYSILLTIAWLPVLILSLWQSLRHRQVRFLLQRFAWAIPRQNSSCIWIHAAFVGEVNAAIPLIKQVQQQCPDKKVIVSTITPTGAQIASQRLDHFQHVYLPLDTRRYMKEFLVRIKPVCVLIMETEL